MTPFEYFTYYLFAPLILCFGLIGNISGLIVFSKKKMIKIGARDMFQYLFIMDTVYLVQIMFNYMSFAYKKTFASLSQFTCKFFFYINYSLDPVSSYLLVYILVDRLVSIKYPTKRSFFRSFKTQLIYFFISIAVNMVVFTPIAVDATFYKIEILNLTFNYCNLNDKQIRAIMLITDLIIRIIIPFFLMTFCSIWLSVTIFLSRRRISASTSSQSNRVLRRDLKFSVTSICLNLVYILLNIPNILVYAIDGLISIELLYQFSFYLFYMPYGINFYLLFISNSVFRKEFFKIVRSLLCIKPSR